MEENYSFFMRKCLELSKKGIGYTSPNPMVGSLLVYNNEIIGEGYHEYFGGPHAEVVCLRNVTKIDLIPNSTLYVSLEPCSHFGKTPPCADLIVNSGVKKVVIAMTDPNPLVTGNGIRKLESNGIEVISGVLKKEAEFLNRKFITFHTKKRPYLILKWAQTNNGILGETNRQIKISEPETDRTVHKWRSEESAILIGCNTAIIDNPQLNVRLIDGKNPTRILVDPELKVPANYHIFRDDDSEVLVFNKVQEGVIRNVHYIKFEQDDFCPLLFSECYARGILSVIIEGGRFTLDQFLKSDIYDEIRVIISDKKILENESSIFAPDIPSLSFEEEKSGSDTILIGFNESNFSVY